MEAALRVKMINVESWRLISGQIYNLRWIAPCLFKSRDGMHRVNERVLTSVEVQMCVLLH